MLWKGAEKHSRIDRLCEKSLVIAPPSIHPTTGRQYRFEARHSPQSIPMPAMVPGWVLDLKPLPPEKPIKPARPTQWERPPKIPLDIEGIRDKVEIARRWGLRVVTSTPDPGGWLQCRAIEREDAKPSCSFHEKSGVYHDHSTGVSLSFVDLAVALHAYPDQVTAFKALRNY